MIIFLIGMMGCGKTTIGRELSKHLSIKFIDLDESVESEECLSIQRIFQTKGEDYFRELESELLKKSIEKEKNCVVACGGGLPIYNKNLEVCLKNGKVIYLKASSKVLYQRIKIDDSRPLKKEFSDFDALFKARNPIYSLAHHTVDASKSVEKICQEILDILSF